MAVASAGPCATLHLAPDRRPRQHPATQFFTDRMPFLQPNQQRQISVICFCYMLKKLLLQMYLIMMAFLPNGAKDHRTC